MRWVTTKLHKLAESRPADCGLTEERSISALSEIVSDDLRSYTIAEVKDDSEGPPVLFEASTYDLYLRWPRTLGEITIIADVPEMLVEIHRIDDDGPNLVVHYRLEIGNEVGVVGIQLISRSVPRLHLGSRCRLEVEVFPRKVDYKTDYREMLNEVGRIAPALVFEASGRTHLSAGLGQAILQTTPEWYEILRAIVVDLCAAIDRIGRDPQRRLQTKKYWVEADRARRTSAIDLERSLRVPGNAIRWPDSAMRGLWPSKVWDRISVNEFDAEGNRIIHSLLRRIASRLAHLEAELRLAGSVWQETQGGRATAKRWSDEIAFIRPQIQKRLSYDWISQAGEHQSGQPSPSIQAHPLYAKVFELGRALFRGLNADTTHVTDAATRSVSSLYEYWCFLAIVDLFRRHAALEQCSAIQLGFQTSRLFLRRGREAAVVFRHRGTGKRLNVSYNRRFDTPTVAQRPDAAVHVESDKAIHVFDAKYRIQFDNDYINLFGGIGPRVDDINTMHRYRDAIVRSTGSDSYDRIVQTACVLFPWHSQESYRTHAFARSLETVGVGGLPFLPSSTNLVAERVAAIVEAAVGNAG